MKRLWHFTLLLSIVGILSLVAVAVINTNITFSLKGDNYYVIPVNENFEDPLFTSLLFKKNVSNRVKITSTLNTSKIGVYYINYDLNYLGKNYSLKRKIEIIDNTKPDIKLNGDNEIFLFVNDLYIEQGATSLDNYDGDITSNIVISDNDSHYFLINYIGKSNLKNYGINLGAYNTLSGGDSYGNTTVMDQIVYLKKLYNLSKNNNDLKSYFINDYGNYLKINDVSVMHKYGYYGSFYHDVGIFLDKYPYIVVVLTTLANDNERAIINNISNLIYDYHNKRS